MRRRHLPCAVAVSLALAGTAGAQTTMGPQPFVDPVRGLTVDQAIAAAMANLPSLKSARAAIAAAEARKVQAGLRPNPTVASGWRGEIGGMGRLNDIAVSLPLDLFRRDARVAAAEAAVTVAETDARRVMFDAELEVRRRYGAVLAAIRHVDVARELADTARTTLDLLSARVAEGASPAIDRDLARVEFDRMSMRVRLAEADAETALVALARAIGMPSHEPLRLRASLETALAQSDVAAPQSDVPAAIDARPDVQTADARIQAAAALIDQARSEGRWDLSVSAGYARMRNGFPFRAFDASGELAPIRATFHNAAAGAMVMIPLFNRNQGAVAAAAAERDAAEADAEAVRLTARAELSQARVDLEAALAVAERYRTEIVPQAERNLATVVQGHDLGRGTLFDVLQARQQLLLVQDEFTTALRRVYDAHVALIAARGGTAR